MLIGVPRESRPDERRVAATPETVRKLVDRKHEVVVEAGAGLASSLPDADYVAAGARLGDPWEAALLLKVQRPSLDEIGRMADEAMVASLVYADDPAFAAALRARHATVFAMEAVPRIARAQKMDVLSSMANIAGYRAVLEATAVFGRFMPMLMTAAGSVPPAQVLVIGAGVAGLSAISTARRLGAVVKAFDTRPAVKDQVKSCGGEFLQLDIGHHDAEDAGGYARAASEEVLRKEREFLAAACKAADIVVSTALVAGKTAPRLIEADTVRAMKPGSVIVDLAVEGGGNCALSRRGEAVVEGGVTILGYTNLPSRMAADASRLYARNLVNLVLHMHGKEGFALDLAEEIVGAVTVMHRGEARIPALGGA
jgi:NAD(P) transhydrogenase subunit alpha